MAGKGRRKGTIRSGAVTSSGGERDGRNEPFDLGGTESPAYLGRAVRALASDSSVSRFSGQVLYVGDLAN